MNHCAADLQSDTITTVRVASSERKRAEDSVDLYRTTGIHAVPALIVPGNSAHSRSGQRKSRVSAEPRQGADVECCVGRNVFQVNDRVAHWRFKDERVRGTLWSASEINGIRARKRG